MPSTRRYFGEALWGASAAQREATTQGDRLATHGLPPLTSEAELAEWLLISPARLRWFTYDRPAEQAWHYTLHRVPKRRGGQRLILAPKEELKALQRTILQEILQLVPPDEAAHGFVRGRSIVSNAAAHVGRVFLLNLDLRDFFPTLTYPRVRGLFISLGYNFEVASLLALLCTGRERERFEHHGKTYFISVGPRHLVQGAPSSPALANLIARGLDRRLRGLATKVGFSYTRYADDLSFSGDSLDGVRALQRYIPPIVTEEGFILHEEKSHLFRHSGRQLVTGLVVNDQVGTPRALRRQLRACLHNAQRTGLAAQNHAGHPDFRAYLQGLIAHVHAANPAQAEALWAALAALPDD